MSADSRAEAARRAQLLRYTQLQRRQRELIIRALEDAKAEILKTMSGAPSDWQRNRLRAIEQSIDASLTRFRNRQIGNWTEGVTSAWALGQALVDAPLGAVGMATNFNRLDDRMLLSMRTWLTNKISDITQAQRSAITAQLQLAATGAQSSQAAINGIAQIFNGDRQRAITITRTELGRAHAAATWLRLKQAHERDPDLKKQWRRSGKLNSRHSHDMADGQVKEVNEFFGVGGEGMMYPRDPTGSAKNTINCGCTILPYKKSWAVATPGPKPFTAGEIARRPLIADANKQIQDKIASAVASMNDAVLARFGTGLGTTLIDAAFAGLSPASAATVSRLEAQIVNSAVEQGAVVSMSGEVLWRGAASTEKRDYFNVPDEAARGHIFTHSHPLDDGFSYFDLMEFATGGALEFRAVVNRTVERLRRGDQSLNRVQAYVWLSEWRTKNYAWYTATRGQPDAIAKINTRLTSEFAEHFKLRYTTRRLP